MHLYIFRKHNVVLFMLFDLTDGLSSIKVKLKFWFRNLFKEQKFVD
jgi:hypothetical protein